MDSSGHSSLTRPRYVPTISAHTSCLLQPQPEMIPFFLRSLASTMSRRFPLAASGDPHAPPATHLYVHSVISLLTLPSPSVSPAAAPLESLNLRDSYQQYLQATHITPLQVLQALLPLLRASPARARDALSNGLGKQSIVVCLPATDARVGLPFASAQAMSAAATLRGVEVLRREIRAAASSASRFASGTATGAADAMRNIKVVVVDVGAIGSTGGDSRAEGLKSSVEEWTPSEQAAYGAAFGSLLEHEGHRGFRRRPSDVSVFVDAVVAVVSNGPRSGSGSGIGNLRGFEGAAARVGLGLRLVFGRLREFVHGDRIAVGAGGKYPSCRAASRLRAMMNAELVLFRYISAHVRTGVAPPDCPAGRAPQRPVPPYIGPQRAPSGLSAARCSPTANSRCSCSCFCSCRAAVCGRGDGSDNGNRDG